MEKGSSKKKQKNSSGRKKRIDLGKKSQSRTTSTAKNVPQEQDSASKPENVPTNTESKEQDDVSKSKSPARSEAGSPEPNCAICLGKLENKSFTDSCFHMFCFVCLVEWSKVKAECPLCKQSFKSIVHNVRSYDDYDQYHIQRPEDLLMGHDFRHAPAFRYRTTMTDHGYVRTRELERLERELRQNVEEQLLQRPGRRRYPVSSHSNWRRMRQAASSEFRARVYALHLKAVNNVNTRRRYREVSPEFFRANPACTHRLVPWLNRELNAIIQGNGERTAFVLEMIMGLIKRYEINSEEFYQHIYPFVGNNTRHFMHEFLMFARSPYHMAAYDQHTVYEPSNDTVENSGTETNTQSDGNDSDVILVSSPGSPYRGPSLPFASATRVTICEFQGAPSLPSVTFPRFGLTSGWDSPTAGPSWDNLNFPDIVPPMRSPPSIQGPSQDTDSIQQQEQHHTIDSSNEESGGNESDVIFVDYEKPWSQRSPINLSSSSDTEINVVSNTPKKHKSKKRKRHDHSNDSSHVSRHRRDRSRSNSHSRSSTKHRRRSRSPLILRLNTSDYRHKKFSYDGRHGMGDNHSSSHYSRSRGRHRLRSSSSDSDHHCRHVSYRSHKKSTRSRSSSIEIVKYRSSSRTKKSKKHKKHSHKKHKKEKRRHRRSSSRTRSVSSGHRNIANSDKDTDTDSESGIVSKHTSGKGDEMSSTEKTRNTILQETNSNDGNSGRVTVIRDGPGPSNVTYIDSSDDNSDINVTDIPQSDDNETTNTLKPAGQEDDGKMSSEVCEKNEVKKFKKHPSGHKKSKKSAENPTNYVSTGTRLENMENNKPASVDGFNEASSSCLSLGDKTTSVTEESKDGKSDIVDIRKEKKSPTGKSHPQTSETVSFISPTSDVTVDCESESDIDIVGFSDKVEDIAGTVDLTVAENGVQMLDSTNIRMSSFLSVVDGLESESTMEYTSDTENKMKAILNKYPPESEQEDNSHLSAIDEGDDSLQVSDTPGVVAAADSPSQVLSMPSNVLNRSSCRNSIGLIPTYDPCSPMTPGKDPLALATEKDWNGGSSEKLPQYYTSRGRDSLVLDNAESALHTRISSSDHVEDCVSRDSSQHSESSDEQDELEESASMSSEDDDDSDSNGETARDKNECGLLSRHEDSTQDYASVSDENTENCIATSKANIDSDSEVDVTNESASELEIHSQAADEIEDNRATASVTPSTDNETNSEPLTSKVAKTVLNRSSCRNSISLIPTYNPSSPLTPGKDPLALATGCDTVMEKIPQYYTNKGRDSLVLDNTESSLQVSDSPAKKRNCKKRDSDWRYSSKFWSKMARKLCAEQVYSDSDSAANNDENMSALCYDSEDIPDTSSQEKVSESDCPQSSQTPQDDTDTDD